MKVIDYTHSNDTNEISQLQAYKSQGTAKSTQHRQFALVGTYSMLYFISSIFNFNFIFFLVSKSFSTRYSELH